MANEARHVEVTPKRASSGSAQWVPALHRHPVAVEDGAHVMRVGALDVEGDDAALVLGAAENAQPVQLAQPLHGIVEQHVLMRLDPLAADALDIVDGRAEPDGLDDGRRAGLESVRRRGVGDASRW